MDKPKTIKSTKPSPDTRSWIEYTWKEEQDTPNRLEDAAKFLASMISISLTIFLAIGKSSFEVKETSWSIKAAIILWLISLLASFFVLFPWRYRYASESVQSIKAMHRRVVFVKRLLLVISLVLFLASLTILAVTIFA
ncbi:MAG: hypothetical protein SVZ03_06265 [Spirochaetota bacterium]|nr:hypothetical protein [Spirochaetota bacterium]